MQKIITKTTNALTIGDFPELEEEEWEEDPETAKMTEEELWDKYGRFSMLHKEKKGNGIQKD